MFQNRTVLDSIFDWVYLKKPTNVTATQLTSDNLPALVVVAVACCSRPSLGGGLGCLSPALPAHRAPTRPCRRAPVSSTD